MNVDQELAKSEQTNSKASPPEVSRLQVLPVAASTKIGEQISLTLQGQNFSSAAEQTSLALTYDPAVMTFKQAIEGPFWTGQQVPPSLTVSVVPNAGQLVIQMGQQGKARSRKWGASLSSLRSHWDWHITYSHSKSDRVRSECSTRAGHGATWESLGGINPPQFVV